AERLEKDGITTAALHGNKSQGARTRALADFKSGKVRVLVATDIAARGLDIDMLPHVVNFDLPNVPEDYVHRIGRTGRAGAVGEAVSLVAGDERGLLKDIERMLRKQIGIFEVEGYTATAPMREERPMRAPKKSQNQHQPTRPGERKRYGVPGGGGRPHKAAEHLAGKSRKVH
ncbi:MAG: helicase-related protein, partial [Stenotrophobium sp.]